MLSLWHAVEGSPTSANLAQHNAESSYACTIRVMPELSSWIVKLASFLSADRAVNRNLFDCSIT